MKKIISIVLAISMIACLFSGLTFSVSAATENGFKYSVSNGKATITKANSSISGDVSIPSTLGGYPVTSIGEYAFYECTGLTSIEIPNSVTSIVDFAFFGCTGLTSITVEEGNPNYHSSGNCLIETASKTLILGCKNSVIPTDGSVTSIGWYAFEGCTGLTSVTIPNIVTSIGEYAFYECTGLTSIEISDSVTSIGNYAFEYCSGLTSIEIPNSVTSIGEEAFRGCTGLTSITIPKSVKSIGSYAFSYCTGLTNIEIPKSVTSIGSGAFYWCTGLTSIEIPASVTCIGYMAFSDCTGLTDVYYTGSEQEWNSISFGSYNESLTNATIHYNYVPHTHSFSETWSFDETNHWKECSCGEKSDVAAHTWDNGVVTTPETCTTKGVKTYTCTVCGQTKTEEIPVKPHTFGEMWLSDATNHWHKCNDCTATTEIAAHDWNNGAITKSPTCDADGEKTHTCTVCGQTKTETIEKTTAHTWDSGKVTKKATCAETGIKTFTCTVCGKTKTEKIAKTTTHTSDGGKVTQATLTKSGKKVYTCKVCKKVLKTETIAYPKTIKISATSYTYNGKVKKPTVSVKDSNGKTIASSNYTLTYSSGCKNVGKYSVKITFKGNYSGTKTFTFTINPKGTTVSKLATPKTKQIKVTIKKNTTQTTGYQIQYSKSKTFKSGNKTVTISKNKTTTKTLTGLTKDKTYYVRIRTYKTVGKTKYYSAWSKAKSVKTR